MITIERREHEIVEFNKIINGQFVINTKKI